MLLSWWKLFFGNTFHEGASMSTTLLYHMYNIRGYRQRSMKFVSGGVEIAIEQPRERIVCPNCGGSDQIILKGKKTRRFLAPPIGGKRVTIVFDVPRIECRECWTLQQVAIPFARPMRRCIRAFERYALDLLLSMTCEDVAKHLGVSWGRIREIEAEHLRKKYAKPRLKDVTHIAIDEIAVRKGHKYMTVVLDLDSGRVIFVGDGRGSDALDPFWKRLRRSRATIRAVATDMSSAYIAAVESALPDAILVFDRFHLIKLFNEKLTALRRRLHREMTEHGEKSALKGARWILLKRPENLNPETSEPQRLAKALASNADLATAYFLKEELSEIWEQDEYDEAEGLLKDWITFAESLEIKEMRDFAKTLRRHALGILAYYDCEITTGPLEGLNNKIKTMKRQAYGFRDMEYFKLKILGIHQTRYALLG
jgi:transposase